MRVSWRTHQSDQSFNFLEWGLLREIELVIRFAERVSEYEAERQR